MNEIENHIDKEIELYRKDGNSMCLGIAKLIKAALIANKHSEIPLSEIEVLQKMTKEREKARDIYIKNNRIDLATKESFELTYISNLLPADPTIEELYHIFMALQEVSDLTIKDTKKVIAEVQSKYPTTQTGTIVKAFKTFLNK